MATKPKTPPPFQFGKPEKPNWMKRFLAWAFIMLVICAIVYMIYTSSPQHALKCQTYNGSGLWSSFGRCEEE